MSLPPDLVRRAQSVLAARGADFRRLAELAGFDPARDFIGADLRGVDFGDDDLSAFLFCDANLYGADLSLVTGLTTSVLAGAIFDASTKFPDDIEDYLNEHAKSAEFWKAGTPPSFVSDFGIDEFGQWFEFSVPGQDGEVTQRMRWIAAGSFLMGSPDSELERWIDEGPQHEVTISEGFWMFDTACPQRLWLAVMGDSNPSRFAGDEHPVETVSWYDVQEFSCRIEITVPGLRLALPSEAQWEYACRAGTVTPFSFGENITPLQVNYDGNYPYAGASTGLCRSKTVPVGSLPPNSWGLHEMHGNVWEWCADDGPRKYQNRAVVDPLGPRIAQKTAARVMRGGSWAGNARLVRSAFRLDYEPNARHDFIGFRCARVHDGAEPRRLLRSGVDRAAASRSGGAEGARWREGDDGARIFPGAETFVIHSDRERATAEPLTCPPWAAAIGRDSYGLWTRIEVPGLDGPVAQRLRWIDPGRFLMGSPEDEKDRGSSEGPRREVTIAAGFWLFETACTQALWTAVIGKNPSGFQGVDRPVENVSWKDAQEFVKAINRKIIGLQLSLPSEAQWEYSCRAGTATPFSFGENVTPKQVRFFTEESEKRFWKGTVKVKTLPANAWGLYEMHGNVREWCADAWHPYYVGAPSDGSAWHGPPTAMRVSRGGSWSDGADHIRSACRIEQAPSTRIDFIGFRCIRVEN